MRSLSGALWELTVNFPKFAVLFWTINDMSSTYQIIRKLDQDGDYDGIRFRAEQV